MAVDPVEKIGFDSIPETVGSDWSTVHPRGEEILRARLGQVSKAQLALYHRRAYVYIVYTIVTKLCTKSG